LAGIWSGAANLPRQPGAHRVFCERRTEAGYAVYIELRAYVYDNARHTALRIRMDNHEEEPYAASVSFSILVNATILNRLGAALERWANSGEAEFIFWLTND